MPVNPIKGSNAPARIGENTEGPEKISDIIPFALSYFSFETIVLIAAM